MPDYKFKQISLRNCPRNAWVDEAINRGKYVLAGHYGRVQRLYETGGVYFDIDIEAIKKFDKFLKDEYFIGMEQDLIVNNAVMGAVKGHPFLKEQMEYMEGFDINHHEVENETGPRMVSNLLYSKGLEKKDETQTVEGITVYKSDYFYPYLYTEAFSKECIKPDTHAIHHWANTWGEKVSIVIAAYNQAQYLPETIESCLNQTYKNIEIIVVNDGSTDNTSEVAKRYPVTLLEKKNGGCSSARNYGIKRSTGQYIICLDSDDTIDPDYVRKLVGKSDIACSGLTEFGEGDASWMPDETKLTLEDFLKNNQIFCSSMFRKEVWEKTGGYDEKITSAYEDWDLWIRAVALGFKIAIVPEYLFNYRKHPESMTMKNIDGNVNKMYRETIFAKHIKLIEKVNCIDASKRVVRDGWVIL